MQRIDSHEPTCLKIIENRNLFFAKKLELENDSFDKWPAI